MNATLVQKIQRIAQMSHFSLYFLMLSSHRVTRSLYQSTSANVREVIYYSIISAFRERGNMFSVAGININ